MSVSIDGFAAVAGAGHGHIKKIILLKTLVVLSTMKKIRSDMQEDLLQAIIDPLRSDLAQTEAIMKRALSMAEPPLDSMLRNALTGGKKMRPAFVILVGRLFRSGRQRLRVLAAAVEVLHSATLIHDDLVDNSSLRRGRKTLNATWPQGATVLAGDHLLALSVSLIARLKNPRVLSILARALATMSQGEITYHYSLHDRKKRAVYFRSIEAKTSALFSAAAEMVAVLAQRGEREITALRAFGREFGITYQIIDDVLDFTAGEERLGKPSAIDLSQGVITLPVICFLDKGGDPKALDRVLSGKYKPPDMRKALQAIRRSGAIEDALMEAHLHADKAKQALARLPETRARQDLADLIDYVVNRDH